MPSVSCSTNGTASPPSSTASSARHVGRGVTPGRRRTGTARHRALLYLSWPLSYAVELKGTLTCCVYMLHAFADNKDSLRIMCSGCQSIVAFRSADFTGAELFLSLLYLYTHVPLLKYKMNLFVHIVSLFRR